MEYTLIRGKRKTLVLSVDNRGQVIVKAPHRCPGYLIEQFVEQKKDWIEERIREQSLLPKRRIFTGEEALQMKRQALQILSRKVSHYAAVLGVTYGTIRVKDQKTRWGSCSSKGNLNFNFRLLQAPGEVQDYVVIHELCHRREMNHSLDFWTLVEAVQPEYRVWKEWLRVHGREL